jgi:hypothetical protein
MGYSLQETYWNTENVDVEIIKMKELKEAIKTVKWKNQLAKIA